MKVKELVERTAQNPLGQVPPNAPDLKITFAHLEKAYNATTGIASSRDLYRLGTRKIVPFRLLHPISDNNPAPTGKYPLVYLYGGKMYLINGNAQVSAAYMSGTENVMVNVVDLHEVQLNINNGK